MEDVQLGVVTTMLGAADKGINDAFRARVLLGSGQSVRAYIKVLDWREIMVETLCACLGRDAGLPVPEPFIVNIPESLGGPIYGFGSQSLPFPDFSRQLNRDAPGAVALLKQWSQIIPAACFDEWILNTDRNAGNLLYQGENEFCLIDHGRALPMHAHVDECCDPNILFDVAVQDTDEARRTSTLLPQTRGSMQTLTAVDLTACQQLAVLSKLPNLQAMLDYLRARQSHLSALGVKHIPLAQGDVFDASSQ